MRETLFRGKIVDNEEWVYGCHVEYPFGRWIAKPSIVPSEDTKDGYFEFIEVTPETVGQFTGLADKNGKMIFEGDIVVSTNERRLSNKACVVRFHPISGYWMLGPKREPVVIGNIYDNPELMGGAEK